MTQSKPEFERQIQTDNPYASPGLDMTAGTSVSNAPLKVQIGWRIGAYLSVSISIFFGVFAAVGIATLIRGDGRIEWNYVPPEIAPALIYVETPATLIAAIIPLTLGAIALFRKSNGKRARPYLWLTFVFSCLAGMSCLAAQLALASYGFIPIGPNSWQQHTFGEDALVETIVLTSILLFPVVYFGLGNLVAATFRRSMR